MALKQNSNFQSEINTGFGTSSNYSGGRFYNRGGNPNVVKRGVGLMDRYSWYHTMLAMPRTKFLLLLFCFYILLNLGFAGIYYMIGIDHLAGMHKGDTMRNFSEVFFFSTQTFTTVGYGRISPTGFLTSTVAMFEAFLGLLSFAIATGLFYGRFSRPRSFLKFSDCALVAPYKGGSALMLRMAPYKNNQLFEGEAKLTLAMKVEEDGKMANKFYSLDLEITKVNALALSWTIVHPITEKSPMYDLTMEDLKNGNAEVLVFVKAFDDVFANTVMARTSYVASEIIWGARFKVMYYANEEKNRTVLDLDMINDHEKVDLLKPVDIRQPVSG